MNIDAATGVLGRVRRSALSDEQLLVRARQGDGYCFEELYRRYHSSLFGYCLMRLMNRQAAEDATQEVFASATATSGPPIQNVKSWLFTIARNAVIDATRRGKASPALVDLEAVVDSPDHAVDETTFSALDVTTNVFIALRRLPARERKALVLREFHDKSSQEIAEELDTRPSNVDVILSRARSAFGRTYAEVAELPFACRKATETIYRQIGSGATDHQLTLMESHLAVCPRCRAEHQRAHAPRFLPGFVPLWWPALGLQGLAPLAAKVRSAIESTAAFLDRSVLPGWPVPARAAAAVAIAATVLTPVVVERVPVKPMPKFESALVSLPASPEGTGPGSTGNSDHQGDMSASPNGQWSVASTTGGVCTESHPKAYSDAAHHGTEPYAAWTEASHSGSGATTHHTGTTDPHTGTDGGHAP